MEQNDSVYMKYMETAEKSVLSYNLNTIISECDEQMYKSIVRKDYEAAANHLADLCYALIDMPEEDQLFTLRVYFISIVTELMISDSRNNQLCPSKMARVKAMIQTINSWEYTSEIFSSIPWFIDTLLGKDTTHTNLIVRNSYVGKALRLINSNLKNNLLSVQWLAKKVDITPTYLSNIFKVEVDETIVSYINKRKIEQITFDLKYTNKSLSELHTNYGYPNKSYFIQVFKKYVGKTPLNYKRAMFE